MLPEMSGLQFLVVQLLLAGSQSGAELRRMMQEAGAKIGPPSFSRLMQRMEKAGYVQAKLKSTKSARRFANPRRFDVTDLGVALWQQTREFYTTGDDPAGNLVPIITEEGQLAHLPQNHRRALIRRRIHRKVKRIFGLTPKKRTSP